MNSSSFIWLKPCTPVDYNGIPCTAIDDFRQAVIQTMSNPDCRVLSFFAMPEENGRFRLICVIGNKASHEMGIASVNIEKEYPALTKDVEAFHWFEREIAEQYGIIPVGHPWLKPIRFQKSETGMDAWKRATEDILPGDTSYFTMDGEAAHEVAVGPIHAGVIEPGHFRFQCMGEVVYHLEIELGYQHRGIEKMLRGVLTPRTVPMVGTMAGDTTIGHTLAFCRALEALAGLKVSDDARKVRAIALELERLANHIGDCGALAGDVAFLPTASFCGRIRGDYLNMTAELCGNRFGRNLVVPGGVGFQLETERIQRLEKKLKTVYPELKQALNMMFDSPTVLDRLENTGTVSRETLVKIGAVGVAARAGGVHLDARYDFPIEEYSGSMPQAAFNVKNGDVMGRAKVRYDEIKTTHDWLFEKLPASESHDVIQRKIPEIPGGKLVVSVVEGWRGEICHVLITGKQGEIRHAKITDPSFHNWFALALALRNGQISDFPICNKSFNLSYCGHDL